MALKAYDDMVLDVAEELELTVKGGDFLRLIERSMERFAQVKLPKSNFTKIEIDFLKKSPDGDAIGSIVQLAFTVPAEFVLAGRPVAPADVAALFVPAQDGNRSIDVKENEKGEVFFILTQRHVIDEEYIDRVSSLLKLQVMVEERIDSLRSRVSTYAEKQERIKSLVKEIQHRLACLKPHDDSLEDKGRWIKEASEVIALTNKLNQGHAGMSDELSALAEIASNMKGA